MSEHDRSGCKVWCGYHSDEDIYGSASESMRDDTAFGPAFLAYKGEPGLRWCSTHCRDAAAPPLSNHPGIPVSSSEGSGQAILGGSAPTPAVGQRWQSTTSDYIYDVFATDDRGCFFVLFDDGSKGRRYVEVIASHKYLGPTPSLSPATTTPGATAGPALPPSAVVASGPPSGYLKCQRSCGRWTKPISAKAILTTCWTCCGSKRHPLAVEYPDWTPPAAAPAPKPARHDTKPHRPQPPAGIKCVRCLCTSEKGDIHGVGCTASDFSPRDANLTPVEWSAQVSAWLRNNELVREAKARPFVAELRDDVDLFWALDVKP